MTSTAAPAQGPWVFPASDEEATAKGKKGRARTTTAAAAPAPPVEADREASVAVLSLAEEADLRPIALSEIHESPLNPRKYYDPVALKEMAESLKTGQLTPCLVRPRTAGGFELAAGHRRRRGALLAGLTHLLCMVREMDDKRFLEVLTIENLQRVDLHQLEEAEGYASLMREVGYDVAQIAERVGRSVKYVYDRLKLLQLTPTAKQHFLEGRFTAGHAILLARLSPEDQARAIDVEDVGRNLGGLYQEEFGRDSLFGAEDDDREPTIKAVSVREFERWIGQHVRFRREQVDPMLFPQTAAALQAAEAAPARPRQRLKVVAITYQNYVQPEARADEKTYGPRSWKRADGEPGYDYDAGKVKPSKTCEHAVLGVIEVGDGRGEAFRVCIAKEKCTVHWPKAKAAKRSRAASDEASRLAEQSSRQAAQYEAERKREEEARARWRKAAPAVLDAIAKAVKQAAPATLAKYLCSKLHLHSAVTGKTADQVLRGVVLGRVRREADNDWSWSREGATIAKVFGVDATKIVDQVAPKEKPKAEAKKAPAKGAKKKGGKAT